MTRGLEGADRQSAALEPIGSAWSTPGTTNGTTVMQGPDGKPLLVLAREGEGRVALLLSDHIWLWARGYEGGGPHLDLLRRLSHWLMKQPELEEEALRLIVQRPRPHGAAADHGRHVDRGDADLADRRDAHARSAAGRARPVAHRRHANELGLWRATDGKLTALANVGPANPREFDEVTSTTDVLQRDRQRHRRRRRAGSTTAAALDVPRVVPVRTATTFKGDDWIGLKMRDVSVVRGIGVLPIFAGLIGLLLLIGSLAATWAREGR